MSPPPRSREPGGSSEPPEPVLKLSEILGQDAAITLLREWSKHDRLHHALVFAGPPGIGKRTIARSFAALLLCQRRNPDLCAECPSCLQVAGGTHPDFYFITHLLKKEEAADVGSRMRFSRGSQPSSKAEDEKKRDHILIDQIRDLQQALAGRALAGGKKIAVVDAAQDLTPEAQNAFLKTLEEPPGDCLIILVSTNLSSLLPTVRSRCQVVRFAPLTAPALVQLLGQRGWSEANARLVAALSGLGLDELLTGEPERLRGLLERVAGVRTALGSGRHRDVVEAARQVLSQTSGTPPELRALLHLSRAELRVAAGCPGSDDLTGFAKTANLDRALRAVETVYAAIRDLDANANRSLAIERMWLCLTDDVAPSR